MQKCIVALLAFVRRHKRLSFAAIAGIFAFPLLILGACSLFILSHNKYVLSTQDATAARGKHIRVGIVLGAGITKSGKPFRELQARLDVAAQALSKGYVSKLILSGDNRFTYYDEPAAMRDYLVTVKHVAPSKLQVDDAGRDTYQSCERAVKVFGVHRTIIFSAGSHLPRAIFLCRSFGIEAYGISSGVEANNATRREFLARTKAVFNVYVLGEHTVLGPHIKV